MARAEKAALRAAEAQVRWTMGGEKSTRCSLLCPPPPTPQISAAAASRAIKVARRPAWFERFHWFITAEGLVVVAGRNAQENEQLFKRYLRPQVRNGGDMEGRMSNGLPMKCLGATGLSLAPPPSQDAYIHAEVHGAATVILRSPSDDPVAGRAMLPLLTHSLEQVGGEGG